MASLDALRGVAALSVVVWHWQHFFYVGDAAARGFDPSTQPLYRLLEPLYLYGWHAVDLFFTLSGFVFYWLYAERIARREVPTAEFVVLRASRLYPLHLATLLLVCVGQPLYRRPAGTPFVYPEFDAYHLALNLGFASSWGLERGSSFNGPIWSVSVEVALYAIFFVACRWVTPRPWLAAALSALGVFVLRDAYLPMGRGVTSFFLGGLVFWAFAQLRRLPVTVRRPLAWGATMLAVAAWVVTFAGVYRGWRLADVRLVWRIEAVYPELVVFPITVLALALQESVREGLGRGLGWLGDISYGAYLLHFPLQLAVASALLALGVSRDVMLSPVALAAFLVATIGLAHLSYVRFERPAQRAGRRWWARRTAPLRDQAPATRAAA